MLIDGLLKHDISSLYQKQLHILSTGQLGFKERKNNFLRGAREVSKTVIPGNRDTLSPTRPI